MKMSKSKLLSMVLVSSSMLTITACGKKSNNAVMPKQFKQAVPHKAIKSGGTLTYALENDSPFTGIFLSELMDTSPDAEASSPGDEGLFDIDDHYTQVKS